MRDNHYSRPTPPASLSGARMLLVENNPLDQDLVRDLLADAGAAATVVADGRAAIDALEHSPYGGVLMDVRMPAMDSYAVTRAIRARAGWQALPIIALTASCSPADREDARRASMNNHIAKPAEVAEMYATIARWVAPAFDVPGVDAAVGRATTRGNEALHRRLLKLFLTRQHATDAHLRALLDAGDRDAAAWVAHDLGGVAANLGMRSLRRCCLALEVACRRDASAPEINGLFGVLSGELGELLQALTRIEPALE